MSAAGHTTSAAAHGIQDGVSNVHQWTDDWGLQISEVKTQPIVFSLSTSKERTNIKLGDRTLPQVETPTFLGLKLDSRLSWKPHIESIQAKVIRKLALLKKLPGTHWGANSKILKTVYTGAVRPTPEYGASAWASTAKMHTNKLDRVQKMGRRTILGAMKSTPIAVMDLNLKRARWSLKRLYILLLEQTAGVKPLETEEKPRFSRMERR